MKSSKGIIRKRQQYILECLRRNKFVKVDELSEQMKVSSITIRRDLQAFEERGIVERFYGGANLIEGMLEEDPSLSVYAERHILKKHTIAKYAASLINDGETIFINSSSTALLIVKYILGKRVIIVTNNGNIINCKRDAYIQVLSTGGEVYENKQSMVGKFALNTLSKINADKAFLGMSGISISGGLTTSMLQETAVNEMMIKHCKGLCTVVADSSKIGKQHNFSTGKIEHISSIITDSDADAEEIQKFKEKGIDVVVLKPLDSDSLDI